MTHKDFLVELANQMGQSQAETSTQMDQLLRVLTQQIEEGQSVAIQGFGTFDVKKKMERVMVSPITKKRMLVPPKLTVSFKPSTSLKDRLK